MLIKPLLYLTFIAFSFGQLGRISLLNQQVNFYLYELLMALTLILIFIKLHLKPLLTSLARVWIVYVFLGYLLLGYLLNFPKFNYEQNLVAFLYWCRLIFYWLYFIYLYYLSFQRKLESSNSGSQIKSGMTFFILLTIVSSLVQYFFYPDLRNLIYLGWDPHLHRLFGVFFDTSLAGAVYGLVFLFLLLHRHSGKAEGRIQNPVSRFWTSQNDLLMLPIYLIFIILTYSRSLYIVFLTTMFWYFISRRKFKLFIATSFIFLTLVIFIPTNFGKGVGLNRLFSIESRLNDYKKAIDTWQKNPVVGIGYNHIQNSQGHASHSFSSSYLNLLVTGGVVGLALFLFLQYKLFVLNKAAGFYILFLGLLSLTDNILLHPFIMFLLGSIFLVGNRDTLRF